MERADAALGFSISRLIAEGPAEELDLTINAQPAILATSIAYLEALRADARQAGIELRPQLLAGHSAGQYAAAVAADAIDFETAMRLVRERGRIMQERGIDGGMGAVIGLTDEQVHDIVDQAREHGEIAVANRNAPGQIVLSGVIPALVFALEMSRTVGARKAARLTVSVASHSPLMRRARDEFGRILAKRPVPRPDAADARQRARQHHPDRRWAAPRAHRAPRPRRAVDRHHPPHGGRRRHRLRGGRPRARADRADPAHRAGHVGPCGRQLRGRTASGSRRDRPPRRRHRVRRPLTGRHRRRCQLGGPGRRPLRHHRHHRIRHHRLRHPRGRRGQGLRRHRAHGRA